MNRPMCFASIIGHGLRNQVILIVLKIYFLTFHIFNRKPVKKTFLYAVRFYEDYITIVN